MCVPEADVYIMFLIHPFSTCRKCQENTPKKICQLHRTLHVLMAGRTNSGKNYKSLWCLNELRKAKNEAVSIANFGMRPRYFQPIRMQRPGTVFDTKTWRLDFLDCDMPTNHSAIHKLFHSHRDRGLGSLNAWSLELAVAAPSSSRIGNSWQVVFLSTFFEQPHIKPKKNFMLRKQRI